MGSSRRRARTAVVVGLAAVLAALVLVPSHPDPRDPGAASAAASQRAHSGRPNVVVVMADDMRADDMRFAPYTRRLMARHGVTFENSFSPYPLCCPARASFLTGRYAHNHGVWSHEAPWGFGAFDDHLTVAGRVKRQGYSTGFVGKYLNGYGAQRSKVTGKPSLHYVPRGWTDWYAAVEPPAGSDVHGGTYNYFDTPFNINGGIDNTHRGEYQTRVIGRFSRQLVDRYHRRDRPFFLYLSYVAPHFGGPVERDDPRNIHNSKGGLVDLRTPARPEWVRGRFDRRVSHAPGLTPHGVAETDMDDKPGFMAGLPPLTKREQRGLTEVTRQRGEAVYVLDQEVKRLVRHLKATHEWSDTVLLFTSDNGYFLGEHRQRTGKIKAHEPSLRVPLLATGPGLGRGVRRYDPATTVDVTATILDLVGVRRPGGDGRSLVPELRGRDRGWRTAVVTEGRISMRSLERGDAPGFRDARNSSGIRTGRWSYIKYRNGARELYDLRTDPNELSSVAHDPAHADVRRALDRVWWDLKDCRGAECRVRLPEELQVGARDERRLTRHFWHAVRARTRG